MLDARIYVSAAQTPSVVAVLEESGWATRISRIGETVDGERQVLSAELDPRGTDRVVAALEAAGLPPADIAIHQVTALRPIEAGIGRSWLGGDPEAFVWLRLVGQARRSASLVGRYLVLMMVAGVVAAFGVIGRNAILIVGAMAVSPDLLPVCAACIGVVGRRSSLVLRSISTLIVGLVLGILAALLLTVLLRALGELDHFELGNGGLGLLTSVNYSTVGIALAAGVAAILAFESNASAAVGVAISVTTIPAAAYMGVAIALGDGRHARDALAVLAVNIVLLLVAGSVTLGLQRLLHRFDR